MTIENAVPPGYIRRDDLDALKRLCLERLRKSGGEFAARSAKRIGAEEDPETAMTAEMQVTIAEFDRAYAAFRLLLGADEAE